MSSTVVRQRAARRGSPRGARQRGDGPGRRQGPGREISLDDKYLLEEGLVLITGLQGLVRIPLDQHRADRRRGLHTARGGDMRW